jgi:branched-chain amino acid aminotransferase
MPGFFMLNGKLHPGTDAIAGPDCRGLRFGDGIFETMRHCGDGIPLFDEHMHRFFSGLRHLQFNVPRHTGPDEVQEMIASLLKKNSVAGQARIRLTAFRGDGGIFDPVDDHPNLLLQCWPLPDNYSVLNENGLQLGVYPGAIKAQDGLSSLKHNNFLPYLMAARHARTERWNDAVILNHEGHIVDSTIANIFWITDGLVFTPPLKDGPDAGIFRRHLMDGLKQAGMPVGERSISPAQLEEAEEVFLTNALFGIRSVAGFAGKEYGRQLTVRLYGDHVKPLFNLS